uniref:Uncharacterized protein n=1 Tax=viral metagenome TaxID=1070528 RepID=A0A6C0HZP6_9ZZZZ
MKGDTITIIVLFAAIIGISLWILHTSSVKSYSPYMPTKYAAYEGYQNLEYSDATTNKSMDNDTHTNNDSSKKCINLTGWNGYGVFCTPNGGLDQIDIYSQAKGDVSCKKSSGYHNSKGGLCLDEKMLGLLQTRGANATGGYSQIGGGSA